MGEYTRRPLIAEGDSLTSQIGADLPSGVSGDNFLDLVDSLGKLEKSIRSEWPKDPGQVQPSLGRWEMQYQGIAAAIDEYAERFPEGAPPGASPLQAAYLNAYLRMGKNVTILVKSRMLHDTLYAQASVSPMVWQ